jgi:hypothetical protein
MIALSTYKGISGYNIDINILESIMNKIKDITGAVSGRLKAIKFSHKQGKNAMWVCECECGNKEHIVRGSKITRGDVKSCGCIAKENQHGMTGTRTYNVWENIIDRTTNPNNKSYKNYGGRGITVCEEWRDFRNFYKDIGELGKGLDIDRIDNDKGYSKENCRLITRSENLENTRRSKWWYIDGVKYRSKAHASEVLGIDPRQVVDWCDGRRKTAGSAARKPKKGCWSELKYKEQE